MTTGMKLEEGWGICLFQQWRHNAPGREGACWEPREFRSALTPEEIRPHGDAH